MTLGEEIRERADPFINSLLGLRGEKRYKAFSNFAAFGKKNGCFDGWLASHCRKKSTKKYR